MQANEREFDILVIEDNAADFCLIEAMLRSSQLPIKNIINAVRVSEACSILSEKKIGLIFLDLSLPDTFGIDSFLKIKPFIANSPVVILTGESQSSVALEALKLGAQDYLVKGEFTPLVLKKSVEYSIERKKAEQKILASEQNYRQTFYKNPFPAWIYDLVSLEILEVNDAAIEKYGYTREEFLKLTVADLRPPDCVAAMWASVKDRKSADKWQKKVWQHQTKAGTEMLMEVTFYNIQYFDRPAMQAQMNDVTEKIRLEKELQMQQVLRQQQIAEAILNAQEEEKKTLGAELHDNINQILATARLYINTGMGDIENRKDILTKGQDYIGMAIEEIRSLSKKLIAPHIASQSLQHSIESLTRDLELMSDLKIVNELDGLGTTGLSEILKINVYRIVQEQLNNILKYAQASKVCISAKIKKEKLVLSISDNGKGFDPAISSKGVGLINMQHRAELFSGTTEILSSPGKGCTVNITFFLNNVNGHKAA